MDTAKRNAPPPSSSSSSPEANSSAPLLPEAGHAIPVAIHDEVFGVIGQDGPNYRNVGWIASAILMMKCQIGLGVLSIPASFNTLGLIPGLVVLTAVAAVTSWSNYMVGVFKLNHADVYGIDDVGAKLFGRAGREVLGIAFALYLITSAGSGMLSVSIALNTLSDHGACTAVFVAVAAAIAICTASIRTLGKVSFLATIGLSSLLIASETPAPSKEPPSGSMLTRKVCTLTVAVAVQDRPAAAPQHGPWSSDYKLVGRPSLTQALSATTTFIFAYAGTPLFFPIIAEMRDPRRYTRALITCQVVVTITYTVIGVVLYLYCGSYVASPALGSAGRVMKKICYGLALPGLSLSSTLSTHASLSHRKQPSQNKSTDCSQLSSKYIFVRILRGSMHLVSNSPTHWATWFGCVVGVAVTAYVVASSVPVFGALVSLIGALFCTLQCFQPMGCMWFYDNWSAERLGEKKFVAMACWSAFVIILGTFLMVGGTYGSVLDLMGANAGSGVWSCTDNSHSV